MRYRAYVERDIPRDGARLHIVQDAGPGRVSILIEGGSAWQTLEDGQRFPDEAGIFLPHEALVPLAAALQEHLGNALPSQAEVSVLREVLKKEQERVDTLFNATVLSVHKAVRD